MPRKTATGGLAVFCARPGSGNPAEAGRQLAARVLEVLQQWLAEPVLGGWRLLIVTERAVDAGPEAGVDPAAAPVWGLVRSAAAESPGRLMLADVDVLAGARELVIAGVGLGEPEFAVRDGQLRVPRLARAATPLAAPSPCGRAARVITGASGGLGQLVAQLHLAASGARQLLLTSRRGPAAPYRAGRPPGRLRCRGAGDRLRRRRPLPASRTDHPGPGGRAAARVIHAAGCWTTG